MNTAFSKAFLLDEAGSKSGITGPNLYVDQSLLEFMQLITSSSHGYSYFVDTKDNHALHGIAYLEQCKERPWCMGLLLDEAIMVDLSGLKTTVFRVRKFFPHDENPEEFAFDLSA